MILTKVVKCHFYFLSGLRGQKIETHYYCRNYFYLCYYLQ